MVMVVEGSATKLVVVMSVQEVVKTDAIPIVLPVLDV